MTAVALTLDFTTTPTLSDRYEAFKTDNPHVIGLIEAMIEKMIREGKTRIAISKVVEDLRSDNDFVTNRGHSSFKFNNDFRSRYSDLVISRHPEWDAIIERRVRTTA